MKRARAAVTLLSAPLLGLSVLGALMPVQFDSREELFEIPNGTWARRRAGDNVEILPSEIRLVVGARDILVQRNLDDVPQIFGPTLIMPGQSFRLPFEVASDYQFECTAHASGQMTVVVDEALTTPWARLRWRSGNILRTLSTL